MIRMKQRKRSAFALIELIAVLVLFAAGMAMITEMFNVGFKLMKEIRQRDTLIHRVDSAIDAMRRDAWGAGSILTTGDSVQFVTGLKRVEWRNDTDATWTRTEVDETRRWIEMPKIQFNLRRPLLVQVDVQSGPTSHEQVTLISQQLLEGKQ